MNYKIIPNTDLNISSITLGTWVMGGDMWGAADDACSCAAIDVAIAAGINCVDTAPVYGWGHAETIVGEALKGKRDKVYIATKCGLRKDGKRISNDLSPDSVRQEAEDSLRRLQTEYIDLYQCHWPDPNTPIEETMEVLSDLQKEKKIRYIGVSNFDAGLVSRAKKIAPVVTDQVQYSLLTRDVEQELVPYCVETQAGILAYGALGGGILTGKYDAPPQFAKSDARSFFYRFYREPGWSKAMSIVDALKEIAQAREVSCARVALQWIIQRPGVVSALAGCRTPEQVEKNIAQPDWMLSEEEMERLNIVSSGL